MLYSTTGCGTIFEQIRIFSTTVKEVIKMDNEKEQIINYWVNKDKTSTHMEPEKLLKHIENFIKEHNTCALATSANDIVRCTRTKM